MREPNRCLFLRKYKSVSWFWKINHRWLQYGCSCVACTTRETKTPHLAWQGDLSNSCRRVGKKRPWLQIEILPMTLSDWCALDSSGLQSLHLDSSGPRTTMLINPLLRAYQSSRFFSRNWNNFVFKKKWRCRVTPIQLKTVGLFTKLCS